VLFFGGKNEMKRRTIFLLALVVFLAFSTCASKLAFAGYLYGISYDYSNPQIPDGVPYLCRIDPTNGSYVTVSQAPPVWGMAYNNSDGYLYGMGSNSNGLLRIDPADGSYDVISVPGIPEITNGLAYNTSDGYLYGTGTAKVTLPGLVDFFRIDITDSSYDLISNSIVLASGLAYNGNNGYLYATALSMTWYYKDLFRIDPADGTCTYIATEPMDFYGLTFNSNDGYLYGFHGAAYPYPPVGTPGSLYRIDPVNGSYVLVSDNSAPNVVALAYIPEPATFLLFAFAAILLRKRR
jgi:hypothetical protein